MKHTREPWSLPHFARNDIDCDCAYIFGDPERSLAVAKIYKPTGNKKIDSEYPPMEQAKENAKRIITCINACKGITTEALDAGIVDWALARAIPSDGIRESTTWEDVKVWEDE